MRSSKPRRATTAFAATVGLLLASVHATSVASESSVVALLEERHYQDPDSLYFELTEDYVVEAGLVSEGLLSPTAELDGVPVAEFIDLAHLADSEGSTLEEAYSKHAHGEDFRTVRDQIEALEPEKFSSAEWLDGSGRISVQGNATPEVVDLIESSPARIELVEGQSYSRAELHLAAQSFAAEMPDGGSVEVHETDGEIVVRMPPGAQSLNDTRVNALRDGVPSGINLTFDELPAPLDDSTNEDNNLRGGAVINGNGNNSCLASFVLHNIQTYSVTRVGTARHCIANSTTSLFTLHGVDGGTTTTLTVQGLGSPSLMDLGLLSHGGWSRQATFYADWNIKRGVYGRSGLPSKGEQICHFRRINGVQCSTVYMHYYASGSDQGTIRVVASHDISDGGDSGGPWFYGTTAKGVHRGSYSGTNTSDFTPAYLYQNMGYEVLFRN